MQAANDSADTKSARRGQFQEDEKNIAATSTAIGLPEKTPRNSERSKRCAKKSKHLHELKASCLNPKSWKGEKFPSTQINFELIHVWKQCFKTNFKQLECVLKWIGRIVSQGVDFRNTSFSHKSWKVSQKSCFSLSFDGRLFFAIRRRSVTCKTDISLVFLYSKV